MNTLTMNNKAYFALPGFVEHFQLYQILNNFLKTYPEAQVKNTEIYCFYGSIPFCTWDGGRPQGDQYPLTIEQMEKLKYFYNNILSSKIRFTFTNSLLTEKDCYNRYNNLSLQIFNSQNNEIVINSSILETYLKNTFSDYSFISSITKCILEPDVIKNEFDKDYKFVCLNYNLNHNWDFLDNLTFKEKQQTELLVNSLCPPNCKNQIEHYKQISNFQLTYGEPYDVKEKCLITETSLCQFGNETIITLDEIFNQYVPKGFQHFKIDGRSKSSYEVALSIAYYLIEPQYRHLFLRHVFVKLYRNQFNFDSLKIIK